MDVLFEYQSFSWIADHCTCTYSRLSGQVTISFNY
jgi:hypothetical protein